MEQDVEMQGADGVEQERDGDVETLRAKVSELEGALQESQTALRASERDRRIERALVGAGALDVETARLLAERALEEEGVADAQEAVEEVRRRKPFLFRGAPGQRFGAMGAAVDEDAALTDAAQAAATSGDRNSLLRYLRLRREKRGA